MNKLLILIFLPFFVNAENRQPKVDSLQLVLMHAHEDTNNVLSRIELSNQLYTMDEYELALEHAMLAKALAEKLGFQSGIASAFRRMGAIYTEQGKYPQAVESLLSSLKLYESLKDAHGIFLTNNNLGTLYYFQQEYDKALEYYFKSHNYKSNDGRTCGNIGMVYAGQANYVQADKFFLLALTYYTSESNENGRALILNNMGAIREFQSDYDKALEYYFQALHIKESLQDNQGICDALASIGDTYYHQKKLQQALKYELQSLTLAKKIGYISSIKETQEMLSKLYFQIGDFAKSLEHYKQFTIAKDSLFNEDYTKSLVSAEKDFEFQKKEEHTRMEQAQKDAVKAEQLKAQRLLKNIFIAGFILVALFLIVLFRGYKIIGQQKKLVEHKNKEVTDNINYAKRIQQAMLPSAEYLRSSFPEHFILYRPKDIVSGDFYWAYKNNNDLYFATADCTGHGVSGAMMSMIGMSLLNDTVIENNCTTPELVLDSMRNKIVQSINKQGASEERKDGMDMVFGRIHDMQLDCACANNPIYIVRNGNLIDVKSDRFPVGKYVNDSKFTLHTIPLEKGDIIYSMSDGFCDQFGEATGKKLMSKRFKQWIVELASLSDMNLMKLELDKRFTAWMGATEQIDDVTIMAIKI